MVSVGALLVKSSIDTYSPFGITRTCTGASGLMSWNASACSSSYTRLQDLAAQDLGEDVVALIGHGAGSSGGIAWLAYGQSAARSAVSSAGRSGARTGATRERLR